MEYEEFKNLLEKYNISLKDFAEINNISYSGCNKWKYSGVPGWVTKWFELYAENQNLNEFKLLAKELCKKFT